MSSTSKTAGEHIATAATAILNSEYADRNPVTAGDARELARVALGHSEEPAEVEVTFKLTGVIPDAAEVAKAVSDHLAELRRHEKEVQA